MFRRHFIFKFVVVLLGTIDFPKLIPRRSQHPVEWRFIFVSSFGSKSLIEFLENREKFEKVDAFGSVNQRFIATGDLLEMKSELNNEVFTQVYHFRNSESAWRWREVILDVREKEQGLIDLSSIEKKYGISVTVEERELT